MYLEEVGRDNEPGSAWIPHWRFRIKPVSGSIYLEEAGRDNDEIVQIDSENDEIVQIASGWIRPEIRYLV